MERNMTMIALFAALIAALGLIPSLTLAFGVPITAQSMGVMLAGAILGAKRGALAVLLFMALVALGLPLLAGGRGGLGTFVAPTSGFFLGWPVAAFVIGLIVERWQSGPLGVTVTLASVIGGILVMYGFGIVGMSIALKKTLAECAMLVTAFLPGDLLKAVLTGAITQALARSRPASILSRH
ncbi:BioY family transporter [Paracoccus sediminis]|uniref:Biotin transporter n=1 Tax=Paracoccus sediminis TaxID=1214787 RepID=A0A238X6H1_9RHOB|nr:biotin transporter BioY [Paracoccus sediminis]TBN48984.1 BioY family transporter [Paracoccus sediminis]SNR54655.1 biotin transport system substrate-specific component [Paracoccus sediminis]